MIVARIVSFFFCSILTADSENQAGTTSEDKHEYEGEEDIGKEEEEENKKIMNDTADSSSSPPTSKSYSCRWCKKGFAYKCRLLVHMKRCSMSKEHEEQCSDCPAKLPNQRALQRHKAEAHRNTTRLRKKVACDLCGRTFAHPSGRAQRVIPGTSDTKHGGATF